MLEQQDWETPATINDTWGFKHYDHNWKSVETLVRKLVDIASKGGNYLLNVGPTAEGVIPEPSVERLLGVGALHGELIAEARLAPGQRVLDVGCGTGSLAVRIRRENPTVEVVGLDPDPKALAIARRKAERAGIAVRFEQGYGDALPFQDATFDRVTSSLMFHHLDLATRRGPPPLPESLGTVRRVAA